jgi:NADH-quinone oxidoreductase subunit C
MALEPAITDLEQLKSHAEVAALVAWNAAAVEGGKFDRDELSIYVGRTALRGACTTLRDDSSLRCDTLSDLTCVDWTPSEPRFEVVYHLFSTVTKKRVRLKVRLAGDDPAVDSLTPLWVGANFFEREVFDLFGVRFNEHPNLKRILMPDNWDGHPLRKDYPVEGYR